VSSSSTSRRSGVLLPAGLVVGDVWPGDSGRQYWS
jgi:hypothetical protein